MTANNTNIADIIVAGSIAEGNGALAGWSGLGTMTRIGIIASIEEAQDATGLAVLSAPFLAPSAKSDVGHAGEALRSLNQTGFIVRAARGARWETNGLKKSRAYRARWTVVIADASAAKVGEAAGRVVLTAELHDGDSELRLEGHPDLAAQVGERYVASRDAEVYSAGDVTAWLSRVLINTFGCARFAVGYFVPPASRTAVEALCSALAARWGRAWICPLLPVADSDQLRAGLARGFSDEIARVERSVDGAEGKGKLTETTAAAFLRELADVDQRADAYRALCGDAAMAPAIAKLAALSERLREIASDAAVRFALLDLDGPTAAERAAAAPAPRLSPAERAAEKAAPRPRDVRDDPEAAIYQAEADPDTAARFSLLELDDGPRIQTEMAPALTVERPLEMDFGTEPCVDDPACEPELSSQSEPEPEVFISEDHARQAYVVRTPYVAAAKQAWRNIPGRRWDKADKVNLIPPSSRKQLFALLREYFPGAIVLGPKGTFTL